MTLRTLLPGRPGQADVSIFKPPKRMFMGKRTVMKKALGTSEEQEYKPGAAQLAKVCLLLSFSLRGVLQQLEN